jgi:hypothetical protein
VKLATVCLHLLLLCFLSHRSVDVLSAESRTTVSTALQELLSVSETVLSQLTRCGWARHSCGGTVAGDGTTEPSGGQLEPFAVEKAQDLSKLERLSGPLHRFLGCLEIFVWDPPLRSTLLILGTCS